MESVDAIVAAVIAAVIMDPAASYNNNTGSILHVKIIINHIGNARSGNHHRDMDLLSLCFPADINVNPLLVLFPPDPDMLRIPMTKGLPVIPQIIGAFLLKAHIIYFL